MNPKLICVVCGILLLLGIPTGWPYVYYVLLRWIICGASIYVAFSFYRANLTGWTWIFAAIALLFNPVLPFYFTKGVWVPLDFISAALFFISGFSTKEK